MSQSNFGLLLKAWRKKANINQPFLARQVGVTDVYISYLESGKRTPSREIVLKIAKELKAPPDKLLAAAGFLPQISQQEIIKFGFENVKQINNDEPSESIMKIASLEAKIDKLLQMQQKYPKPSPIPRINPKDLEINEINSMIPLPHFGEIACGEPCPVWDEPEEIIYWPKSVAEKATCTLKAKGDSMESWGIKEGDVIFVKQTNSATSGKTVIARVNKEYYTCKVYQEKDDERFLVPKSQKKDKYDILNFKKYDIEIVGIVVGKFEQW